jgi:hypothetical protein
VFANLDRVKSYTGVFMMRVAAKLSGINENDPAILKEYFNHMYRRH